MRSDEITESDHLQEALGRSLARVHTHVQHRSIGIISANLESNTAEQDAHARHALTTAVKQAGYGYSHIKGVGKERDATTSEPSFLIIGHEGDDPALKRFLIQQGQRFDQSSVIFKSGTSDQAFGIYTRDDEQNGKRVGDENAWGEWHANRTAAQFFSALKGKGQFDFHDDDDEIQVAYTRPKTFSNRDESLM